MKVILLVHSDKVQIIKTSHLFSSLDYNELARLADLAVNRSLASNEFAFWEGEAPEWFYIVARGRVKVVAS